MTMTLDSHEKFFIHELKDLYSAENQLIEALPKVIKAVDKQEVKDALSSHLAETKEHAKRIERIFKTLEWEPGGVKCAGMEGLVKEGDEVMKEKQLPKNLITEALVAGGQKIENYEIVAYESAIKSARQLGHADAAALLSESLSEEQAALEKLKHFA